MSHDVKIYGMDVHKEAIVIAVLNGSGKLVMETVQEIDLKRFSKSWNHGSCVREGSTDVIRITP